MYCTKLTFNNTECSKMEDFTTKTPDKRTEYTNMHLTFDNDHTINKRNFDVKCDKIREHFCYLY